ncbi:MAG TPA: hypothetical protein VFY99_06610 [Solirubrobacterales bacterium]
MIGRATIVLAIALLGACATPALAEQTIFASTPTIKLDRGGSADRVFGKVRSDARACEQRRKIRLLHRPVDQKQRWSVVAKMRTDGTGAWSFRPEPNSAGDRFATAGNWHVKVNEVKVNSGGGVITCKEKFSSSMFVG